MMDFDFSKTEKSLSADIKALFNEDSARDLARLEISDTEEARRILLRWLERLSWIGYLDLGLDDGRNSPGLTAAQETLATLSPSLFLCTEMTARVLGRLLSVHASPEQKSRLLPRLRAGSLLGTVALSEGGMSLEGHRINTRCNPTETNLEVTGEKHYVLNAAVSDRIAVAGETDSGPAVFLLSPETRGISVGERLGTLGYREVAVTSLSLHGCIVSREDLVGPFSNAEPFESLRMWEDQVLAAAGLGLMHRSFDAAVFHAKNHKRGGKPIIAYQEVGFKLAEMLTVIHAAQLLAYRAAWMAETRDSEAPALVRSAKVFCSEGAEEVASKAIQILGAEGFVLGNPAEESFRNAKFLQVAGTSTEISRVKLGEDVLGRA